MEPFDLAFLDPPYGKGLADAALAAMVDGGWLKPGAVVVVEETATATITLPVGLTIVDERQQGETRLTFLRAADDECSAP
jgi:16S rRNA (guanine966-N2)-methyltransferase